ncbi:ubiquitin binding protein [Amylocystis lapponica]|nr:ubiquitin binding protein [Amylocystis lapponica]
MSYFSSLLWGTSQVDDAVDKATSELLPSGAEDIALNLEICDQIRSKSVSPKDAMRALKRRLNHKNPNVQLLALGLTDTCIKNGGDLFLAEIASRDFMDNLVSILKIPTLNHDVKTKILRLVQNWAVAFEGKSNLSYVGEIYKTLQHEGFNFPPRDPVVTSSAMVDTQTAPEWIDSDVCLRCRTPFSFTNRKHHCRNCGQVFDHQCSSKTMPLPHFGITQEVRVCESCYTKLNKKPIKNHRTSQSVSSSRHRSAREFADAELQRAIQLSLEEVGAASSYRPGYIPPPSPWQPSDPPLVDHSTHPRSNASPYRSQEEEDDPELKAAIEASLREASAPRPSAPAIPISVRSHSPEQQSGAYGAGYGYPQSYPPSAATPKPRAPTIPNYDLEPLEADAILTFSQTVDQVQAQGGRDLSRYPAVSELFDKANSLRPKLAMNLSDTGRKEQMLSEMHDKLSQAVKLYDKLLTEQLSRPTWRTTSAVPSTSYQQVNPGYDPRYQSIDTSYNQWTSEQAQQPLSPRMQTAEPSHFANVPPQHASLSSGTYVPSLVADTYSAQMYQPQPPIISQQSSQDSQQYIHDATRYGPTSPLPVTVPQYGASVPVPPPPFSPPVSQQSYQFRDPPVQQPIATQQPPNQQIQSGPLPQVPQVSSPQPPFSGISQPLVSASSQLSRHNTVAAFPSSSPAPSSSLTRHATMSHAPQQLHQLQQIAVPNAQLPNFPIVPTSSPQGYRMYGSPIPAGAETERKEALLIDL